MGNANSGPKREKPFLEALRMELLAAGTNHKALRSIARQLINKASEGDMQAIIEFANRMDGKPMQAVEVTQLDSHEDMLSQLDEPVHVTH